MSRPIFYEIPKQPGEVVRIPGFDFGALLQTGETITGAFVTIRERVSGADTTATMLGVGSPVLVGSKVSFDVKLGTDNVDYVATVRVTTSASREYHGEVILFIRERPY